MAEDEKFLSRWAKRKEQARAGTLQEDAPAAAPDEEQVAALGNPGEGAAEEAADHPAADIDIDALDADSDFKVFMHEKVPQAIRRRALRKLWFGDPIFSELDGLNDYDEDFTDAATVVEGLKATYDEAVKRMKEREAAEAKEAKKAEEAAADSDAQAEDESARQVEGSQSADADMPADVEDEDPDDGTDEA